MNIATISTNYIYIERERDNINNKKFLIVKICGFVNMTKWTWAMKMTRSWGLSVLLYSVRLRDRSYGCDTIRGQSSPLDPSSQRAHTCRSNISDRHYGWEPPIGEMVRLWSLLWQVRFDSCQGLSTFNNFLANVEEPRGGL